MKIAFIGAGSLVFGKNLLTDLATIPSLKKDTVVYLEDIDPKRLDLMYRYIQTYKEKYSEETEGISFEKTTDQKKAVEGAKYIINAVNTGGLEAFKLDVDIPAKYGVTQCVGDTLGPGGVFRFLRTVPFYESLLKDIQDGAFNADGNADKPILLNYTNPMVMNTWYCNSLYPDSTVGLCHGVQGTATILSYAASGKKQLTLTADNISFLCAGINHMAWFLEVWYKDQDDPNAQWVDAYPRIKKFMRENPETMESEKLRVDMMNATGYFMTESSGHLSEYIPYYRKRKDLLERFRGGPSAHSTLEHAADYDMNFERQGKMEKQFERAIKRGRAPFKKTASGEYCAFIINAMETDIPYRFNGNVMNKQGGLITNLPDDCCVEVPVFADAHGLLPQGGIELPTICQALCMSNVMVQKSAVEGALERDKEKIYHAVLLDPNTASVCSPSEIREMVGEMFEAEARFIPKFD